MIGRIDHTHRAKRCPAIAAARVSIFRPVPQSRWPGCCPVNQPTIPPVAATRGSPCRWARCLCACGARLPLLRRPSVHCLALPAPMAPAQQPSQSPFHRFRLNDFQRVEPSSASNAAGQCSRFRVTDFVPWSESPATTPQPTAPTNGVSTKSALPANAASPSTVVGGAQRSGFLVMHMDVDSCAPQQTSTAVATAGSVGSGKGMLQVKQTGAPTNVCLSPLHWRCNPLMAG